MCKFFRQLDLTIRFGFVLALLSAMLGCSERETRIDEAALAPSSTEDRGAGREALEPQKAQPSEELTPIYFDYDKWAIKPKARDTLRKHAEWLKKHPDATLQIEGHCDERGTPQYNLALGEKRAAAARAYLVALGIEENRLGAVSYGAEQVEKEDLMARARKAVFIVIYSK